MSVLSGSWLDEQASATTTRLGRRGGRGVGRLGCCLRSVARPGRWRRPGGLGCCPCGAARLSLNPSIPGDPGDQEARGVLPSPHQSPHDLGCLPSSPETPGPAPKGWTQPPGCNAQAGFVLCHSIEIAIPCLLILLIRIK